MNLIAIIPARKGSKGLSNKNKRILGNKPLFMHSLDYAINSNLFAKIIVSTDDEQIMQYANDRGPYCEELRPSYLCRDNSKSVDVAIYHIEKLEERGLVFDYICLLQPTSPYRPLEETVNAIKDFMAAKGDSLVSLRKVPSHFNPEWLFKINSNNFAENVSTKAMASRRQDLKEYYHRDGAIYLTRVALLKKNKSLLSGKLMPLKIHSKELINIDTIEDWNIAKKYFK